VFAVFSLPTGLSEDMEEAELPAVPPEVTAPPVDPAGSAGLIFWLATASLGPLLVEDEAAAEAECQLVSSWETKCRSRSKYWL